MTTEYTVFCFQPFDGRIAIFERPQSTSGTPLFGLMNTSSAISFAPLGDSLITSSNCSTTAFGVAPTALFCGDTFSTSGGAKSGGPPGGAA